MLLELQTGFDDLFGRARGVSTTAVATRDAEAGRDYIYRNVSADDISHLLCDPTKAEQGKAALAKWPTQKKLIIDRLAAGDFSFYLSTAEAIHYPLLRQAIDLAHMQCLTTIGVLFNPYDQPAYEMRVPATIDDMADITREEFSDYLYDNLTKNYATALKRKVVKEFFKQRISPAASLDFVVAQSIKYNKTNPVEGRYFTDEQWRAIWKHWPEWNHHRADVADSNITILLRALSIHGAKDPGKRGQYSKRSQDDLAEYKYMKNELATYSQRRVRRVSSAGSSSQQRELHMKQSRVMASIQNELTFHTANILPDYLKA